MELFNKEIPIIKKAMIFAQHEYPKNDPFHCRGHIENVMTRAKEIMEKLSKDIDHEALELAIIFHDIDYNSEENTEKNYENHVDNSIKVAGAFLQENAYPEERIKKVQQIMLDHSSPHRKIFGDAKNIEGKIIYDADKSIFITTPELYERYFAKLYLDETRDMVKPAL